MNNHRVVLLVALLTFLMLPSAWAGSVVNQNTAGSAGTAVTVSHTAVTQLLRAQMGRYSWSLYCSGTAGTIAIMIMPGGSDGTAASPAPSATVGFPVPANTIVSQHDYILRGLDSLHQRLDAFAAGGSDVPCYTWEDR